MLSSHERVETLKLRKRANLPQFPRASWFSRWNSVPRHVPWRETQSIPYLCASVHVPQHSTHHKAHAVTRVYMREMDGVLQGLGVGPLSYTHSRLPVSICSFPETAALRTRAETWWRYPCGWSPLTGSREQTGIHQSADGAGRRVAPKSY